MARRIHTPVLREGEIALDAAQARHARTVLRLADGAEVEVFDDAGRTAVGVLVHQGPHGTAVRIERLGPDDPVVDRTGGEGRAIQRFRWSVAAAVPKGERADWMVEKLSELGADAFVPLATARAVVLPEGRNKLERWARIATESAKQSRRRGVMRIEPLTPLTRAVEAATAAPAGSPWAGAGWCLSTQRTAISIWGAATEALKRQAGPAGSPASLTLFIGPEGGWTAEELERMASAGLTAVRLTETVLRVETAAIAAGAIVAAAGMG